jgi:ABC-type multidrug transport system permease subunit
MRRERNAAEFTFWLVIGILCTPNALGVVPLPRSLAEGPWFLARASVIALWLGCFAAIVGILWRNRADGEAIQQVALVAIGFGGLFYAAALVSANLGDVAKALLAVAFVAGVGFGALARYVQLRGWWPPIRRDP